MTTVEEGRHHGWRGVMDGRVLRGVVAVAALATCADASAGKCDNSTWIQKANIQAENILLLLSGETERGACTCLLSLPHSARRDTREFTSTRP